VTVAFATISSTRQRFLFESGRVSTIRTVSPFEAPSSSWAMKVDVRLIAATNRDLDEAMRKGTFRNDLFYRLNVFPLEVPPLRERRSDIPQLVMFFLSHFARRFDKQIEAVPQETMDRLANYPWPGNIRELQNIIERACALAEGASRLRVGSSVAVTITMGNSCSKSATNSRS